MGSHWEVLGFQGTNPETDLNRFGGMCNLLHVLHFLSFNLSMLEDIFALARDDVGFCFCTTTRA